MAWGLASIGEHNPKSTRSSNGLLYTTHLYTTLPCLDPFLRLAAPSFRFPIVIWPFSNELFSGVACILLQIEKTLIDSSAVN